MTTAKRERIWTILASFGAMVAIALLATMEAEASTVGQMSFANGEISGEAISCTRTTKSLNKDGENSQSRSNKSVRSQTAK